MKKYLALSGYFKDTEILPVSIVERKEVLYEYQPEDIIFGVKIPDTAQIFDYEEMLKELTLCYEKYQKRAKET